MVNSFQSFFRRSLIIIDFCEPNKLTGSFSGADISEGVPPYPLYKRFASALQQWIISGSFFSTSENVPELLCEDESLKEIKYKWNELVSQKGSELVYVSCFIEVILIDVYWKMERVYELGTVIFFLMEKSLFSVDVEEHQI